ncbi:unnamed protein product [Larinioides sclopetarius]|uniref:Uncharacterized protein n=1 Tax=Larinioides sclopetarius TaxID=280406 RepID=A0AAV2BZQ1_9ARAC
MTPKRHSSGLSGTKCNIYKSQRMIRVSKIKCSLKLMNNAMNIVYYDIFHRHPVLYY